MGQETVAAVVAAAAAAVAEAAAIGKHTTCEKLEWDWESFEKGIAPKDGAHLHNQTFKNKFKTAMDWTKVVIIGGNSTVTNVYEIASKYDNKE